MTGCPFIRQNISCTAVGTTLVSRLPVECPFHHTTVTRDDFWVPGDFYLKPENNSHLRDHRTEVVTHVTRVRQRACDSGKEDFHLEGMSLPLKRQL